MYTTLLLIGVAVCVFSLLSSIYFIRKQQHKALDKNTSMTTVKHPVISNPIVLAYFALPILIIFGAIIWTLF